MTDQHRRKKTRQYMEKEKQESISFFLVSLGGNVQREAFCIVKKCSSWEVVLKMMMLM